MLRLVSVSLALLLWTPASIAETVQDDWVFPQKPDYSTTVQLDKEYTIQWTSALSTWFPNYCPDCDPNSVDLWVTGAGSDQHKLASGVNVTSSTSIAWTARVPTNELQHSASWVLRFIPSGEDPSSSKEEISSSIFLINNPDTSSSSTTRASSPTTTSSTTTSSATSASTKPTTTSSATGGAGSSTTDDPPSSDTTCRPSLHHKCPTHSSSGLTTGAKAGIGIGVAVGAILLFGLGWFIARRQGNKNKDRGDAPAADAAMTQDPGPGPEPYIYNGYGKTPSEVHGSAPHTYSPPPFGADQSYGYPAHGQGHAPVSAHVSEVEGSRGPAAAEMA
ncbi:hypothetical protein F4808DRAFT_126429 [Astrocystis sublimbata]|nr:hypothetical protein F4808DRAFT_126429 [Astrocystis sublimbata]